MHNRKIFLILDVWVSMINIRLVINNSTPKLTCEKWSRSIEYSVVVKALLLILIVRRLNSQSWFQTNKNPIMADNIPFRNAIFRCDVRVLVRYMFANKPLKNSSPVFSMILNRSK